MKYLQLELNKLLKKDRSILQDLESTSSDGIWFSDLENPENDWMNDMFWETIGYDPAEMASKNVSRRNYINPDDLALVDTVFNKHIKDPNYPYDLTIRYNHKLGNTIWVRCRGLILKDDNNKPTRMLGINTDITQQKTVEIELRQNLRRYNQII